MLNFILNIATFHKKVFLTFNGVFFMSAKLAVGRVATSPEGNAAKEQKVHYQFWMDCNRNAFKMIEARTEERVDERQVSKKLVRAIAQARYYRILDVAREAVKGVFTPEEVSLLLDGCASPILTGEFSERVADIYYSEFGEELVAVGSREYRLCVKLTGLTVLQELGLIDVIECAWRGTHRFEYAMAHLGSEMEDEALV